MSLSAKAALKKNKGKGKKAKVSSSAPSDQTPLLRLSSPEGEGRVSHA